MIYHSDRGSQYGSTTYKKVLKDADTQLSIKLKAQDDAFAERVNATIKNEYVNLWYINSLRNLRVKTKKAVKHYNTKRQHDSLNGKTPKEFKIYVLNLITQKRPMAIIYADGNYKVMVASSHHDFIPKKSTSDS